MKNTIPDEQLRTEVYPMCLRLMKKGFELEAYILILATWNFALLRYVMRTFDLKGFKRTLKEIEPTFRELRNLSFKTISLDKYEDEIKSIYNALSQYDGIKYTGAPKLMHLKNPKLFVMWDKRIKESYGFKKSSADDYYNFFKLMQKKFKKHQSRKGMTLARTVDLINMENITEKVINKRQRHKPGS